MRNSTGPRWPLLFLPALLLLTACGVPIAAEDITATAESQQASQQLTIIGDAALARPALLQDTRFVGTPSPVSTLGALATGTPGPSVTPNASTTPGATSTVEATATITATAEASTTPPATPGTETPTPTSTVQPTVSVPTTDFGAQVVALVNEYRVSNGLGRLTADPFITTASSNYAELYGTQAGNAPTFSHTGPDGSSPFQRMAASGYGGCFWGEAVAAGQTSAASAVAAWKASGQHNAILLDPEATTIGVGYYYAGGSLYKHYWVLMTGRPGQQQPGGACLF